MRSGIVQTHLRNQLVNENNNTDGTDEAAQERSAEDRVKEAEPAESGNQDEGTSETSDHSSNSRVLLACLVRVVTSIDGLAHHLACQ